jgi:hypothetical protein
MDYIACYDEALEVPSDPLNPILTENTLLQLGCDALFGPQCFT